jgi:hypothetical protein
MKPEQQFALDQAFILAASNGYNAIMHNLLTVGADLHAWRDAALINAAEGGLTETVDYLLLRGADSRNLLALSKAAKNGHWETVRVLMKWYDQSAPSPSP